MPWYGLELPDNPARPVCCIVACAASTKRYDVDCVPLDVRSPGDGPTRAPSLRPSSEVCAGMPSINGHLFVVVEQPMTRGHACNYAFTQLCCRSVGPLVSTPTDQENRVVASLALPQNRGLGIAPTSARQREGSRNASDSLLMRVIRTNVRDSTAMGPGIRSRLYAADKNKNKYYCK
jgi:hypothetical protein